MGDADRPSSESNSSLRVLYDFRNASEVSALLNVGRWRVYKLARAGRVEADRTAEKRTLFAVRSSDDHVEYARPVAFSSWVSGTYDFAVDGLAFSKHGRAFSTLRSLIASMAAICLLLAGSIAYWVHGKAEVSHGAIG